MWEHTSASLVINDRVVPVGAALAAAKRPKDLDETVGGRTATDEQREMRHDDSLSWAPESGRVLSSDGWNGSDPCYLVPTARHAIPRLSGIGVGIVAAVANATARAGAALSDVKVGRACPTRCVT